MAWISTVIVVMGVGAGALGWVRHRWTVVTVRGTSMSPTIEDGDRVLVRRCAGSELRSGHIAVASPPGHDRSKWNVKRAVALPGDPVPVDVRAVVHGEVVPPGALVMRGDNPLSLDSRQLGFYSLDDVMGIVTYQMSTGRQVSAPSRARDAH